MVEARGIERSPNFATQWDHATSFEFLQSSFPAPCNVVHLNARLVSRPVPSGQGGGGRREEIPWPRADEFTHGNFLSKDHFGFGESNGPSSCRLASSRLLDSASSRCGRFPRSASEKIALNPATATARTLHDSRIHSRRACPALTHATFTTRSAGSCLSTSTRGIPIKIPVSLRWLADIPAKTLGSGQYFSGGNRRC